MAIRFQVDPDFYDHPKSIDLSDAATALWVRAGSYSAAKLLDGFVPEHVLSRLSRSPEEASGELVACRLWRRVKGGFRFHQWSERNLTKARVESDREYDRTRKRRERQEARENGNTQAKPANVRTGLRSDSTSDSGRSPDRSVSVSVSESVSGSGRDSPPVRTDQAAAGPEPPTNCHDHIGDPSPPPCGPCADARREHARWTAARAARLAKAPKCRTHRGQLAHNCGLCRSDAIGAIE